MVDVFNSSDFVGMQIEYVKFREILQILDLLNVILSKHEHSQCWDGMQMANFFDVIVVQVEEDEVW